MHRKKTILLIVGLAVFSVLLAACAAATAAPTSPPPTPPPPATEAAPAPTAAPQPTAVPGPVVPNEQAWMNSPHNDAESEPFKHWDTTADKMVPTACAQCHTTTGYQDYLGLDGSTVDKVDKPVAIGETVQCVACHNDKASNLNSVKFLSGAEIKNLGPEARCIECHQGRATMKQVDDQITAFNATDPDAVVPPKKDGDKTVPFSFINPHYFAAALSLFGDQVKGGYQYEGKLYDQKNQHVSGMNTCVECHDPHTTEVQVEKCSECHQDVKTKEDLKNIRQVSSAFDYNGNGDVKEGISAEVAGLQASLLKAIQSYAKDVVKMGTVYDPAAYPYFFQDKDNDGQADKDDKGNPIAYAAWTPRMLKAAYNYQLSIKDPGSYAHNPKYNIQLLNDSIADLNTKLTAKVDMTKMVRDDAAHFAGDTMPFRDWDEAGEVPATCAKCHSAGGLPQFIHNGGKVLLTNTGGLEVTGVTGQPPANGFECTTCHDGANFPKLYPVSSVPFPNGKSLTFSTQKDDKGNLVPVNANICIECHQGRQSTVTMNSYLSAFKENDKVDPKIAFKNVHYFPAGATLFGTQAQGIYEYTGKQYAGRNAHVENMNTCTDCHDQHALTIKTDKCAGCHKVDDPKMIRMSKENFDGAKDANEPMYLVIENFKTRLYTAIQKYATEKSKAGIVYDAAAYPYFFLDANADGKADVDDKGAPVAFNAWTPRLLRAAYNYQYAVKDPGAFAHNPQYVLQALYDSIQDLGGDSTGLVRPTVEPPASQ